MTGPRIHAARQRWLVQRIRLVQRITATQRRLAARRIQTVQRIWAPERVLEHSPEVAPTTAEHE